MWTTEKGSVLAGWLYELDTMAVSVMFAQAGRWDPTPDTWHPLTAQTADFESWIFNTRSGGAKKGG
jgi:hypothetical protein